MGGVAINHQASKAAETNANDKINLGVIGIGPRCTYDLKAMLNFDDIRCIAISDVQESRRLAGKKLVDEAYGTNDCVLYPDFRDLLARPEIDAVLIATGDRWHADASILAAQAGKDVYSEKPCGITIERCQTLAKTIAETGRVFQAGTSSGQSLRRERWGSGSSATGETMDDLLSRLFSQVERLHVAE